MSFVGRLREHDAFGCGCCSSYDYAQYEDRAAAIAADLLPSQAELAEWLREIFTADPGGASWDTIAEELLLLLNGDA